MTHQLIILFVPYLATGISTATQILLKHFSQRGYIQYAGWKQIQDQDLIIQNMKGKEVMFLFTGSDTDVCAAHQT